VVTINDMKSGPIQSVNILKGNGIVGRNLRKCKQIYNRFEVNLKYFTE